MTAVRSRAGYDAFARTLHWLVFALVTAQFVVALAMPDIGRGTVPGVLINLHLSLGITILAAITIRWAWRLGHPVPLATDDLPAWERIVARGLHVTLYALLAVNPLLGWANASARDWNVTVFGIVALPRLVARQDRYGRLAGDLHVYLAWTLLALIGLHVAAALYHHLVRRDQVLQRMLGDRPRGPSV
jgi:cytochrome b561